MLKDKQAGFTLVELIIVMAISSSLALLAFVGQRQLRARAQFDASVNKVVASVADARNQAVAGVNIVGSGDGTSACPGGPAGEYVFAGIAWTADNALAGGPIKFDYYKALPGSASPNAACIFQTQLIGIPTPLTVTLPPAGPGGRTLFVRNARGGLTVCPVPNLTANVALSFRDGACTPGTLSLRLSDDEGYTSQLLVDQSGLARRQN